MNPDNTSPERLSQIEIHYEVAQAQKRILARICHPSLSTRTESLLRESLRLVYSASWPGSGSAVGQS